MSRSASELLRHEAAQAAFPGWRLLEVTGRDRERFLHSQLSSDLRALAVGGGQLSTLLDASGRLQAFFFVHKLAEAVRLLVPAAAARHAVEQLSARVVADEVEIAGIETGPMRLVLGPASAERATLIPAGQRFPVAGWGARGVVCWGADPVDLPELDAEELEARRVVSGLPRWGVEAVAGMLVTESSLVDSAVSLDKGCYLGQETVAKIARGRGASYAPALLRLGGEMADPASLAGESFAAGERERAGSVRSWARWEGSTFLQAALHRELRVAGLALACRFRSGLELAATVVPLPLLRTPTPDEEAEALLLRASELFAADREQEAIILLERALSVAPGAADAYEVLGVILGRHRRFEEAIALMRRLLEVDPDSVMAHTNMSVYYRELGRIEEAEQEARTASVKAAERQRRGRSRADLERELRERETADRARRAEMFTTVLDIDPGDALANFGLGQLKLEAGAPHEALALLERALAADADQSAAYLALGSTWEALGELDRAREVYTTGVAVAARRGDLKTANAMQERLATLGRPRS